jgi:hypothetical protein
VQAVVPGHVPRIVVPENADGLRRVGGEVDRALRGGSTIARAGAPGAATLRLVDAVGAVLTAGGPPGPAPRRSSGRNEYGIAGLAPFVCPAVRSQYGV